MQTVERWLKEAIADRTARRKGPGGEDGTGAGDTTRPGEEGLDDDLDVLIDSIQEAREHTARSQQKQAENDLTAVSSLALPSCLLAFLSSCLHTHTCRT